MPRSFPDRPSPARRRNGSADLDTVLSEKLAKVGLIQRRKVATLQAFISDYIASRVDVKPATREIWCQGKRGLSTFSAAASRPEITAGDADNYKMHLIGQGLAP